MNYEAKRRRQGIWFSSLWDSPRTGIFPKSGVMTTTVDQRRRAVLPFRPGDVLEVEKQTEDVIVLRRMKAAVGPRPKLVRRRGRLVFAGGAAISSEEVKRILEEFP